MAVANNARKILQPVRMRREAARAGSQVSGGGGGRV